MVYHIQKVSSFLRFCSLCVIQLKHYVSEAQPAFET